MTFYSSTAQVLDFTIPDVLKRTISYSPRDLAPMVSPVPRTLLIDHDPIFCYSFDRFARKYHVPIRTFHSVAAFNKDHRWDYDLVLLDHDSLGDLSLEVVEKLREHHAPVPVLFIGYEQPSVQEMKDWPEQVCGFSNKDFGLDSVFNDAVKAFAVPKVKRSHLVRVK